MGKHNTQSAFVQWMKKQTCQDKHENISCLNYKIMAKLTGISETSLKTWFSYGKIKGIQVAHVERLKTVCAMFDEQVDVYGEWIKPAILEYNLKKFGE